MARVRVSQRTGRAAAKSEARVFLSEMEAFAVRRALSSERNPNHLIGFASVMSPTYPTIASLLYARAKLLQLRSRTYQNELASDAKEASAELVRILNDAGFPGKQCIEWLSEPPINTAAFLARATRWWPEVASAWRDVTPAPVSWPRLDRMRAAAETANEMRDFRLAQGPASRARSLDIANAIILRPHEDSSPLETSLREGGFIDAYSMTRGRNLRERVQDFMLARRKAREQGYTALDALIQRRRAELPSHLEHEVRKTAGSLVIDPASPVQDLPTPVTNLARAVVREVGPNIRIVDPDAARLAFTTTPPAEPRDVLDERRRWIDWHMRRERMSKS